MKLKNAEINILKDTATEFELHLKGEKETVIEPPIYHEPFEITANEKRGGFNFHSVELKSISWVLLENGQAVREGFDNDLKSNYQGIKDIRDLRNGMYQLEASGKSLSGQLTAVKRIAYEITMGTDAPDPGLPACPRGPKIDHVLSSNTQGIRFRFDGDGVFKMHVRFAGKAFVVEPKSNVVQIDTAIPVGDHVLEIEGANCSSPVSSTEFRVMADPTDPGEPTEPGDKSHGVIATTETRFMNIDLKKNADGSFSITDTAMLDIPPGYEYWYIFDIQKKVHKTKTPLNNFKWIGSGILSLEKRVYKEGVVVEVEWNNFNNGWGGRDHGWGTSFNGQPCIGGQAILMLGPDHTVPEWKGKSTAPEWSIKAPPMKLPEGKYMSFHAVLAQEAPLDHQDPPVGSKNPVPKNRLDRGETHLDDWGKWKDINRSLVCDRTVGLVYMGITPENSKHKPNGEYDDSLEKLYQAGYNWQAAGISCKECNEGRIWIAHDGPHMRALMEGVRDRAKADGIKDPAYMSGYGAVGYSGLGIGFADAETIAIRRRMYSMSKDEIRKNFPYFNAMGDSMNAVNIKYYGHVAEHHRVMMDHIIQVEISKRAGYKVLGFPGNLKEIIDYAGYDLGALWEQKLPDGGSVVTRHIFRPGWTDMFNHGALMMWYGDGFILWDAAGNIGVDPNFVGDWGEQSYFKDGGSKSPVPPKNVGYYPAITMHVYDALYAGAAFYNSFSETEGGERKYVDHELNGVKYRAEADGSTAITAFVNSHGVAQVRTKGNSKTLMYYNPCLGNERSILKVNGFKDHEIVGNKVYMFKE